MCAIRANLTLICHQLRSPGNLGSIARLLANFELEQLVLSEPMVRDYQAAQQRAVGAAHVLAAMRVTSSLREAIQDSLYVVATTSRASLKGRTPLTPEVAAQRLMEHARRGRVAWVLGGEKRGLSDEELALCTDVAVIPTGERQPSMNVSHAAAVLLYLSAGCAQAPAPPKERPSGARLATLHALEGRLGALLQRSGFLNPQAPTPVLRELVRTLERSQLSQREAELWLSALAHLARGASDPTD